MSSKHSEMLSPSASGLWMICTGMPTLKKEKGIKDTSSPEAERGTLQHTYAELLDKGELKKEEFSPKVMAKETDIELVEWVDVQTSVAAMQRELAKYPSKKFKDFYECEVGFTDDWRTEGFGTVDRARLDITNRFLFIGDHKFGRVKVAAAGNSQLRIYALAAIQTLKAKGADVDKLIDKVILAISQPKVSSELDFEELTLDELYAWDRDVLQPAQREVLAGGKIIPGDHCEGKYCKVKGKCDAYLNLNENIMDEFMEKHYNGDAQKTIDSLDPLELSDFLLKSRVLIGAVDLATKAAKEFILKGVDVPGYKPVNGRGKNEWTDEAAGEKLLTSAKIKKAERCPSKLLTAPQAKTLLQGLGVFDKFKERYEELVKYTPGEITIAHESDSRKAVEIVTEGIDESLEDILDEMSGMTADVDCDDILSEFLSDDSDPIEVDEDDLLADL